MFAAAGRGIEASVMPGYVALTILCSFLHAVGQGMQKHGMATRLPRITVRRLVLRFGDFARAMFTNWVWVAGLLVNTTGAVVSIQAIAMGDLTVVKPLAKLQTVFLVIIGVIALREQITRRECAAIALMATAAIALGLTATPSVGVVPGATADVLMCLVSVGFVVTTLLARSRWPARISAEFALASSAGMLFGLGDLMIKSATGAVRLASGSFNVLHNESWLALLATPEFYVILTANIAGFILNQAAFSNGRLSVIGPLLSIGGTLFPILAGFLLFDEPAYPLRVFGIVAMFAGATMIMTRGTPAVAAAPSLALARVREPESP